MKGIFTGLAAGMFLLSCTAAQDAQTRRDQLSTLKGDWQISHIDHQPGFSIKPFGETADLKCFVGSTWTLVPNNDSGSYSIKGSESCPEVTRSIKYEVTADNEFRFKKIAAGTKAKDNTSGYILNLQNHMQDHFTLVQNIPYSGQVLKVSYHFNRVK